MLCAVAKPGHRKNQSCVKKLCVAAARLLYLRDYQANTQYDAYHCTADQRLGALDLEVLIEINTECRSYHTLWEEKKETNSRYFPEQQVVLTPQRNTSSQVSQIMNYGNYKSVIFWGLCILETQLYSEKKNSYLQTTLISSKIGTSGNKISQFLFHLMMSIFHLVSITFSSNENWWLIFDDSSTKHWNVKVWIKSKIKFFFFFQLPHSKFVGIQGWYTSYQNNWETGMQSGPSDLRWWLIPCHHTSWFSTNGANI